MSREPDRPQSERRDLVSADRSGDGSERLPDMSGEPAKLLRIGNMVKEILEELRRSELDEDTRREVRRMQERIVKELKDIVSPELREELDAMAVPFDKDVPSESELRVAQAQLRGWVEGLFHGLQVALWSQQLEAQSRLGQLREEPRETDTGGRNAATPYL